MTGVIINADDFGLTDGICIAILEMLESRSISSTTLMTAANGAIARFKRYRANELAGLAGVHLQLTGGHPVSPASEIPTLVDTRTGGFLDPRKGGAPDPSEVYLEWGRQIERASEALGAAPTHLDTHHGMHRRPELFEVYVALARELRIPFRGAVGEIAQEITRRRLPGTTALVRDWTGKDLTAEHLRKMVLRQAADHPSAGVIEVICHPGYVDDDLRAVSSLADPREQDRIGVVTLRSTGWPECDGLSMTSFGDHWPASQWDNAVG